VIVKRFLVIFAMMDQLLLAGDVQFEAVDLGSGGATAVATTSASFCPIKLRQNPLKVVIIFLSSQGVVC
jgi:hypothetical protein